MKNKRLALVVLFALLCFVFLLSLSLGRFLIPIEDTARILATRFFPSIPKTWEQRAENVIYAIRFPRTVGAMLVGGALACAGTTYQGIFRNSIVSPDLLGVSSGACVGAAIAILTGSGLVGIQALAFIGGLVAVGMSLSLPRLISNNGTFTLVLSGIVVSGFMNSVLSLIKYVADPDYQLANIVYWTLGSLSSVTFRDLSYMSLPIVVSIAVVASLRWRINIASLDDAQAVSLGMDISKFRLLFILCSTIMTASAICLSGTVGWIGLVVPHLGRMIIGNDSRYSVPASILIGAIFTVVIDIFARNLSASEIPLSILTGIVGTPLFVAILLRQKRRGISL